MPATAEAHTYDAPLSHAPATESQLANCAAALKQAFGVSFTFWDGQTGELLRASLEQPAGNDLFRGQLVRAVLFGKPQFLADEDAVLLLAIPLEVRPGGRVIGTAAFVAREVGPKEYLNGAATLLGLDQLRAMAWIQRQAVWSADSLLRVARSVQAQIRAELRAAELEQEAEKLSDNLAATYEEICLLHGVTQNLRINRDEDQLCTLILNGLLDCLPARSVAIQLLPVAKEGQITYQARTQSVLYAAGECPLDSASFTQLIDILHLELGCGPLVANHAVTQAPDWPFPEVEQLIVVPMAEGDLLLGWMAVFNHTSGGEFGAVEANLVNSIASILGIHGGNLNLYREQSEFLASVVRALTSAIDAKDRYTCGHSDRVGRIAVRLAKELGCDAEMLHTIYMAGLLHDIGKIGVDDAVLRKPDKLNGEEFAQIKHHPELGYRILADIKQLADVLPAVVHHHEQWNGSGYPLGLAGEQIPLIARIVAVADAYDAMSADRPYRRGMPLEKAEQIFRDGAGRQWDPEVIDAYFAARGDIRAIAQEERANLTLDVRQWT